MAKNLKKFVNPRFTQAVDLALLRRLFEPVGDDLKGLDLAIFDGEPEVARQGVTDFFAGPEENYPESLAGALHQIAELGTAQGLQLILEQARRLQVQFGPANDNQDGTEARQEPKHMALLAFLDYPAVFKAASDVLSYSTLASYSEYGAVEEGIEMEVDATAMAAFRDAAARLFETELRGRFCQVSHYDDDGEFHVVVTHGAPFKTTRVVDGDTAHIISLRETDQAVLSYSPAIGLLKVGGFAKARRQELAEIFAAVLLQRPQFFAAPDAQDLYTLAPVERAGMSFSFQHAFDRGIRSVQIIEAQADRLGPDPRSGKPKAYWSLVARDSRYSALVRLLEGRREIVFGTDWRLNHIVLRVHFDVGETKPVRVTVKLKPPGTAMFKRQRFEGRIMELLRRNGLVNDRDARQSAVAAE